MKLGLTLLGMWCISATSLAAHSLEFAGYIKLKRETLFIINDLDTGTISGWIPEGTSFQGYRIVGFDLKSTTLFVRGSTGSLSLPLKDSKIVEESSSPNRASFAVRIFLDGTVDFQGSTIDLATLMGRLRSIAGEQSEIALALQLPTQMTEAARHTVNDIGKLGDTSGFKKFTMRVTNSPPVPGSTKGPMIYQVKPP